MQFLLFQQKLKNFPVFNLRDIRKLELDFDLRRLSEWQDKGYIKMVRNGYYIFSDLELNEFTLFTIANKIYSPSYISLEMAFSFYHLIPEAVYGITSVTSQKKNNFRTDFGEFIYRHIKQELLCGYQLVKHGQQTFSIADIEKALLDYLYLNSHLKTENDFYELRFNIDEFKARFNLGKINRYLEQFQSKSLEKRVKTFFKYIKYA